MIATALQLQRMPPLSPWYPLPSTPSPHCPNPFVLHGQQDSLLHCLRL